MKSDSGQGTNLYPSAKPGHMPTSRAGGFINLTPISWTENGGWVISPKENLASVTQKVHRVDASLVKTIDVLICDFCSFGFCLWKLWYKNIYLSLLYQPETEIKRIVQLLLCYYSPVVFTPLQTLCPLNPFHCLCSGSGHYCSPTLLQPLRCSTARLIIHFTRVQGAREPSGI